MKISLSKILVAAALTLGVNVYAQAEGQQANETPNQTKVWIRSIKTDENFVPYREVKSTNGSYFNFYPDEWVIVEGEKNGNVEYDSLKFATDVAPITDYKSMRQVDLAVIDQLRKKIEAGLSVADSTDLNVDLSGIEDEGWVLLIANDEIVDTLKYGQPYTKKLTDLKLKDTGKLRFIPKDLPGSIVPLSKIKWVKTKEDPDDKWTRHETNNDLGANIIKWAIYAIIVIALILIGYLIYLKLGKTKLTSPTLNDAFDNLEKAIDSLDDEIGKQNLSKDNINILRKNLDDFEKHIKNAKKDIRRDNDLLNYKNAIADQLNSFAEKLDQINASDYTNAVNQLKSLIGSSSSLIYNAKNGKLEASTNSTTADNFITTIDGGENVTIYDDKRYQPKPDSRDKALNKQIEKIQREKDDLEKKLNEERAKREDLVAKERQKIENRAQQAVNEANNKAHKAEERATKAEERTRAITDELNAKFDRERQTLHASITDLKTNLKATQVDLKATQDNLNEETKQHNAAKRTIEQLENEARAFNEKITGVNSSRPYCERVNALIDLSKKIQTTAQEIMSAGMSDPYFAYKALAMYQSKINELNIPSFYTDVEMVSKTGFVIKGTPLAGYDQRKSDAELEAMTRDYFFSTYLKTYIGALVVLNESLIGLRYLVNDANAGCIAKFERYRTELQTAIRALGIEAHTVKIYDSVGVNTDLLATEIDAGYAKHGAILEIANCKVNLIGGAPDQERIRVKIQK